MKAKDKIDVANILILIKNAHEAYRNVLVARLAHITLKDLKTFASEKYKEDIRKWMIKLNSGKYIQSYGMLAICYSNDKDIRYCCLGVLCSLNKESKKKDGRGANTRLIDHHLNVQKLKRFQKFLNNSAIDKVYEVLNDILIFNFKQIVTFTKHILIPAIKKNDFKELEDCFNQKINFRLNRYTETKIIK